MSSQQQSMQNEEISVTLSKEPGCVVKLDITVSPKACQAAYHKAIKAVSKEVSIPGFRKGKAPDSFIISNFAKPVDQEWRQTLVNTAFRDALDLTQIFPFNENSIHSVSLKDASLTDGARVTAEYEVFPTIPEIPFDQLQIGSISRREITEKEINDGVEEMLLRRAEWKEITDRPAQEGDFITVDIDVIDEPAHNVCTDTMLFLKPEQMEKWMFRLLVGAESGAVIEGVSEQDECSSCKEGEPGHHHEHEEFKPRQCRIIVHGIKEAVKPPLDDAFAKSMGAENVEDFKGKLEKTLNQQADIEKKNRQRQAVQLELLKRCLFDIPKSIIANTLKQAHRNIIDSLRHEGVEENEMEARAQAAKIDLANRIEMQTRMQFLLQHIVNKQKLEIDNAELSMEIMKDLFFNQMQGKKSDESEEERASRIKSDMLITKALDFLLEKANIE